jgi:glutathione S-transferase/translation elongation factor EF-1beta
MKLYTNAPGHILYLIPAAVAQITQAHVETVIVSAETQETPEFKAKRGTHGKFPMLELADGSMIYESIAIGEYIARASNFSANLMGRTAFEEAEISQWVMFAATGNMPHVGPIYRNTFGYEFKADSYANAVKGIKEQMKLMNSRLVGKSFLVGGRLTYADIVNFTSLIMPFAFVLDAGFRKAMPDVSAWFERVSKQSAIINVAGAVKMCEKPIKPIDTANLPVVVAKAVEVVEEVAAVVEEVKAADDEDEFDPFADDEPEDAEAEKAKQARFAEIAKTAKSYGKVVVAKSLVIWEVKPWGEETDLDVLAAKILAIQQDGLFWKTGYKKEPIAYGVFKLVIGATIEDDKVSTDDIADLIEAFEDEVQSVDIAAFNKL